MELSERKQQILKTIIAEYIRTAEPVGSKALSELPELSFSSATIRNEMSELEEMGYLEKPHTSAGRVPSHKGYRFYVDHLMRRPVAPISAKDETALMALKSKELDRLIQEAGRLISSLTNYAAVAVTPHLSHMTIRQFELISVDERTYVVVIVTDANVVKNKLVHTAAPVTKAEAELLAYVLNQILTAIPITQITTERFDVVQRAAGLTALLAPVAEFISELIEDMGNQKVFLEGANKLLRFPEYHDTSKAQTLLAYMNDDKKHLIPIQHEIDGVQIFIGNENGQNPLSDTSMIYAKYGIGDIGQGMIGIVGPTRMDYAALSARLSGFAKGLNKLIAETFYDENK
ncbi:MAG: heat-inducible transcription repressor HrcA [Butyricicoccus pullicaecorum]|nr:heat-inducible transcription repressor HrcA [Butyricicoccus pullicaecorum]